MLIAIFVLINVSAQQAGRIRLEGESGVIQSAVVSSDRKGYSGSGYVTGIINPKARISWTFIAKPGIYEAMIGYSASSERGLTISVNGLKVSAMAPATGDEFHEAKLGKVELKAGQNQLSVERGWGYYDLDYLDLVPAQKLSPLSKLIPQLADHHAIPEAKSLYRRLLRNYGRTTISGQYETGNYDTRENEFVRQQTGFLPAIIGGDVGDSSPSRVAHKPPPDLVPDWIEASKKGQILTLSWHWYAPTDLIDDPHHLNSDGKVEDDSWGWGFYTRASTFDLSKVIDDPESERYKLLLRDIDAIAVLLRRLQDQHVPVLWRPLHEAQGGWFWWGAKGPEPCKKLWRLVFDRLTKIDGVHDLIWVWNSPKEAWYPGDDVVDIVSVDNYPDDRRDPLTADWESLLSRFNGRKPIALAEFPGAPDVARMQRLGAFWLYFVSWYGSVGPRTTPPEILRSTYDAKTVTKLTSPNSVKKP